MVTDNLFGDILTDEAGAVTGGVGLAASGNINPEGAFPSMFEPIHGSAPDIAGRDIANPLATILSVAMMFRHSFGMADAAARIEAAVREVLRKGFRTRDIYHEGTTLVGTTAMGDRVADLLKT